MTLATLTDRMGLALVHLFTNPLVARDRAAHLIDLIRVEKGSNLWAEAQRTLDVREDFRRFGTSDIDRDAALVGALREYVIGTWRQPPDHMDVFGALVHMGVPPSMATQRTGAVA